MRNQLVWLHGDAWTQIQASPWDAQALDVLSHWQNRRLPLVVCRQRPGAAPDQVCLGLPAPRQWSSRRLALTAGRMHITDCGAFPSLLQVAQANPWGSAATELAESLSGDGVDAQVYGSHGWQWLTGLAYVHAASDIDLILPVRSMAAAAGTVQRLDGARLAGRLDGEIVFPAGQAIAWREMQQLLAGRASQVLVKDLQHITLARLTDVAALVPPLAVALH